MAWGPRIAMPLGYPVIVAALALALVSSGAGCAGTESVEDRQRASTRVDLAKDFLLQGELQPAATEAERALAHDRRNEEAHNILGLVSFFRALSNFQLLEVDGCLTGVDAEALRMEMDEHLLEAAKHFERAVHFAPTFGEAWSNRGTVSLRLGDHREAIQYFDEALAHPARLMNPAVTRANLGWAYFELGRHPEAAKELRQARQFQPNMCVATYRLGRVYFERQEWENALDSFDAVVASNCRIQEAHLYRMKSLTELGMIDDLAGDEAACIALAPRSCVAARCRALVP
jgi:Tfp pilus assembly protein PilF